MDGRMKILCTTFVSLFALLAVAVRSQVVEPLKLIETIPMPDLHDGDFDHFAASVSDHRLFLTGEENGAVEVFDLSTNKLIHTISGLKAPHSVVYRADSKRLFVVDGDAGAVKIYQGDSFAPSGSIKLMEDADSSVYDPSTKSMYVVNGGGDAGYSLISVIDTTAGAKVADIKVNAEGVEAMALEKSGSRLFANLEDKNAVVVIDREKRAVIATWSIEKEGKKNGPIAFDEADHRLFVVAHDPGKVIVLDSNSGKILNSLPCIGYTDDAVFDPGTRRLYVSGVPSLDIFQLIGPNRFRQIGQLPSSFHGVTAILVPELNRYFVAVNRHGNTPAQVQVYEVVR